MPPVQLTVPLSLDAATRDRLGRILSASGAELDARLAELAAAALEEYALAFSGTRAPSTMRELRELRLCLLFEHLPDGVPTDAQIAQLFQLTPAQTGTLIAGARARFGAQLTQRLRAAAVAAIETATPLGDGRLRIVLPNSLHRYLKEIVDESSAPPMELRRDATRTYDLRRSTVEAICRALALPLEQVPRPRR